MKRKNTLLGIALILVLTLVLCACDAGGSGKSGSTLNLDYEGGEDAAQEEEKQNGGSWFSDAFSFGKKDNSNSDDPDGSYVQGDDDSTAGVIPLTLFCISLYRNVPSAINPHRMRIFHFPLSIARASLSGHTSRHGQMSPHDSFCFSIVYPLLILICIS